MNKHNQNKEGEKDNCQLLIVNYQLPKKSLMQQLFTGKKLFSYLPGNH